MLDNNTESQEYEDDDILIIEPGQESFYESGSESSDDDLQSSVARVDSLNQILKDVCTELYCINNNLSAQCNDPVHTPQMFAPHANSTPHTVHQHTTHKMAPGGLLLKAAQTINRNYQ